MVKLLEKLNKKKQKLIEESERIKAERMRSKHKNIENMKPSLRKILRQGLYEKKSVLQVMRETNTYLKEKQEAKDSEQT